MNGEVFPRRQVEKCFSLVCFSSVTESRCWPRRERKKKIYPSWTICSTSMENTFTNSKKKKRKNRNGPDKHTSPSFPPLQQKGRGSKKKKCGRVIVSPILFFFT
ncbi:hypothetical protein, unlikely [Trypanosoma brucei gambiense DAL972]|uniref:Uncharacterized protein n=1 Tax=Trypanosoma brucei gambiense (strain MHOM/CI/86/DAL972) TaxID=679716 RepID=D0A4W7_TRYB9|nr:hypothetical protein, unlikely [Trypanosoma brucei gambiense DAL972]CBH16311.1 hypothetical protein, unlikely [Trypanosoma brucei gambiense DAL972]|eukprot:XP_011778575.1 hypothetical protein, unlikely [Trypanosoma brucei gambiense DAL972]